MATVLVRPLATSLLVLGSSASRCSSPRRCWLQRARAKTLRIVPKSIAGLVWVLVGILLAGFARCFCGTFNCF